MARAADITLSDAERGVLEARAAKLTLAYRDVQRARIVLYAAEGMSKRRDRGARADVLQGRRTVAATIHQHRLDGLRDQARRVDRAAFPPERVAEVKAVACEPPARRAAVASLDG
jgi:hypothetical protein